MILALASCVVTASLVVAVDLGATVLGPVLIVVGALAGGKALSSWWHHLKQEWFLAELVLVSASWSLFGAAFAGLQFLVLGFVPGAFFVDADYAQAAAPRYRRPWTRDSIRASQGWADYSEAIDLVIDGPGTFEVDSIVVLPGGERVTLRDSCHDSSLEFDCDVRLEIGRLAPTPSLSLAIDRDGTADGRISRDRLVRDLRDRATGHRLELAAASEKLRDPAAHIQPRIGDLLYETAIAFSGRDSGIFAPIGAVARLFKVIESLASYLLFGIVVSRVAAAAGSVRGVDTGPPAAGP